MSSLSLLLLFITFIIFEYISDYLLNHQHSISLKTNKQARISTLCALYFAQGFPWGFMTIALDQPFWIVLMVSCRVFFILNSIVTSISSIF